MSLRAIWKTELYTTSTIGFHNIVRFQREVQPEVGHVGSAAARAHPDFFRKNSVLQILCPVNAGDDRWQQLEVTR